MYRGGILRSKTLLSVQILVVFLLLRKPPKQLSASENLGVLSGNSIYYSSPVGTLRDSTYTYYGSMTWVVQRL